MDPTLAMRLVVLACALLCQPAAATSRETRHLTPRFIQHPEERAQPTSELSRSSSSAGEDAKAPAAPAEGPTNEDNEIDFEDRIRVGEPYKSLLQSGARFALAQTKISNHVNVDTLMNILNDVSYQLSRPAVLFRVLKIAGVLVASLTTSAFLFPGSQSFLDSVYRDPLGTLNMERYLSGGLGEGSVLATLGSKTEEALSRVGLQETSCRERSLCYAGEILRCSFPQSSLSVTKFARDNFSDNGIKDNIFARAFLSGFVERNCTSVGSSAQNQNCLANFVSSLLGSPSPAPRSANRRRST